MNTLQIFFISLVASGSSFNLSYVLPNTDPWYVPDFLNGTFKWIERSLVEAEIGAMAYIPDLVDYYLYTKLNPTNNQVLEEHHLQSLQESNFNATNPTRIIIHGFRSSYDMDICNLIRNAYLNEGLYNIICVDWSEIAQKTYPTARFLALAVGENLAVFIEFLNKYGGMSYEDLIVIGHSLGAHVAGIAGKTLQEKGKKIPVIIGCDPAKPLFDYNDCSTRLCKSDAGSVESIQTSGGRLGFLRPIGNVSFYPNGGVTQPGCGIDPIGSCAHSRSYEYLAEAIDFNDFPTIKCKDYKRAVAKRCGSKYSSIKMASYSSFQAEGVFFVPVNSKSKFGKGS